MKPKQPTPCPPKQQKPKPPTFAECLEIMGGGTGPQGPDGPVGDPGPAMSTPYDPDQSCSYVKGQVIYDNGSLWAATTNCPQGEPGSSPDYSLVTNVVAQGVTGPTGPRGQDGESVVIPYDPDQSHSYKQGQMIYKDGKVYYVTKDNPQGVPGSSPDYEEIPPSLTEGPTGPMGPNGFADAMIYDPNMACSYKKGQLIYYSGNLYVATTDCPQGTPGESCDYLLVSMTAMVGLTGPAGEQGTRFPTPWDPNDATAYVPGDIVYYNGNLYEVNTDNPQGTPGDSPDYTLIPNQQLDGPMGPPGSIIVNFYDPNGIYKKGDLVYYQGELYVVNRDNPVGPPDQSSDYTLVDNIWSATGPGGLMGPVGEPGDCGCPGLQGQNMFNVLWLLAIWNDLQNRIDNQQDALNDINNQLDEDEDRNDQDEKTIEDIKNGTPSDTVIKLLNSASYCACPSGGGCAPYMLYADSNNTHIGQIGTPCVVGTFFGCPVYRQCYYGAATSSALTGNVTMNLPTSTGTPGFIVDTGGTWYDITAGTTVAGSGEGIAGGFPAGAFMIAMTGTMNTADGTFAFSGSGKNNLASSSVLINNGQLQYNINGGNLSTHQYRFWTWVDYVDKDCTPTPAAT